MEITCIMCPVGCSLNVEKDKDGKIVVSGNSCPRGAIYGEKEITSPERMVTTVKKFKNGTITLKLDKPISKNLVEKCLKEIALCKEPNNIKVGEILLHNVCSTNCNVIVTSVNL